MLRKKDGKCAEGLTRTSGYQTYTGSVLGCEAGGVTDTENSSTPWAKRGLVGSATNVCKDLWVNF